MLAPARAAFDTGRPYTLDDIENYNGVGERPILGLNQGYSTQRPSSESGSGDGNGPQVVIYDDLGSNPSLDWINGNNVGLMGDRWGTRGSYDPVSGTALNSPRSLSAQLYLQALEDPTLMSYLENTYKQHGRDFRTEGQRAMATGPRGNATQYMRTG